MSATCTHGVRWFQECAACGWARHQLEDAGFAAFIPDREWALPSTSPWRSLRHFVEEVRMPLAPGDLRKDVLAQEVRAKVAHHFQGPSGSALGVCVGHWGWVDLRDGLTLQTVQLSDGGGPVSVAYVRVLWQYPIAEVGSLITNPLVAEAAVPLSELELGTPRAVELSEVLDALRRA